MSKRSVKPEGATGGDVSEQPIDPAGVDATRAAEGTGTDGDAGEGSEGGGRTFGNVLRDGWEHVGAGWWRNVTTGDRERRPGKKSGRSGSPRVARNLGGSAPAAGPQGGKKAGLALASIERILLSIHFGLSVVSKSPELELTQEEAKAYAESVAMVARHYDVGASAKTLDWFNLGTTMAAIYGMRVMMIADRRRRERSGERNQDGPHPFANGHDRTAPVEPGPADGSGIDFSSMTGRRPN